MSWGAEGGGKLREQREAFGKGSTPPRHHSLRRASSSKLSGIYTVFFDHNKERNSSLTNWCSPWQAPALWAVAWPEPRAAAHATLRRNLSKPFPVKVETSNDSQ